jgi:hypothetical protein
MKRKAYQLLLIISVASFSVNAEVLSYYCSYPNYSDEEGLSKSNEFNIEFKYDTVTEDAFMVGNNGLSKVVGIKKSEGITFLELLSTGAVQTTTIASNDKSVHSRHTLLWGDLMPSQYYGRCKNEKL